MEEKLKRLNLNIPEKLHKKLKEIALNKNITLRLLVMKKLIEIIEEYKKYN